MYQLNIEDCPQELVDAISDNLEVAGAVAVTFMDRFDDQIFEPELGTLPLWPHVMLQALFSNIEDATQELHNIAGVYPNLKMNVVTLPAEDWERTCLQDLQPLQFGEKLWICPSWLTPPDPTAVNIILDPGLAFGTGTHPTTALCLNWLGSAYILDKTIIDYGCGSGILALAALKLGAVHAYAIDLDPQALTATKNNAATNNIALQNLTCALPNSQDIAPVDILIANILLAPLLSLTKIFHKLLTHNGKLILSGLLEEQTEQIIAAYKPLFYHETTQQQGDWVLIELLRK